MTQRAVLPGTLPHPSPGPTSAARASWRPRLALGALVLLLLAWWLAGLGAAPLFDVDEGAFAEASREMLASGDWGHTTLNGADRFDKPILVYWLQAISLAVFGLNEFAVRLPSALCAWGWCLALAAFAWPRFGPAVALLSAAMLATSLGPALIGRAATADALLNLLIALAAFDLWRHLESGAAAPRRRAFTWIGLGLLAKGPIALLVPLAAVLIWAGSKRAWPALRRLVADPIAWGLLIATSLPWYAYALARHGDAFIDGFIVRHNLARYGGPLEAHGGSLGYYLLVLPLLLWPWTPLLAAVLGRARALWRDDLARYLLGWAGFVLVFFSLSGTKLPHYALYGATPLVLLAARASRSVGPGMVAAVLACCALLLAAGAFSPALAGWAGERSGDPLWQALLDAAALQAAPYGSALLLALPAALLIAWAGACRGIGVRRPMQATAAACASAHPAWPATAVAALVATGVWVALAMPWWGEALQGGVREHAARAREAGAHVVQWRLHQPSLAFYLREPAPRRAPQPDEWALTRLDRLSPDEAAHWSVVAARGPLALVRHAAPAPFTSPTETGVRP
jgi:4-amino-4-deoxy-L-arabinose transferase-like glycosyltransferase